MDELPKHARALLDVARDADDPSQAARAHSDAAVRAGLARQGIHDVPALETRLQPGLGSGAATARAGLGLKLGIVATVLVGAAVGVRVLWPTPVAPPPTRIGESRAPARPAEPSVDHPPALESTTRPAVPTEKPDGRTVADTTHGRRGARVGRHTDPAGDDAALARELRVLASADELVRGGQYAQALRLLERTEPTAVRALREERSALRVLASCGNEPSPQALRERDRFLSSSPHSVLAARVRSACAAGPDERR